MLLLLIEVRVKRSATKPKNKASLLKFCLHKKLLKEEIW